MFDDTQTKSGVSITEMAKMVGLSYQRFSQLRQSGVFPEPVYNVESKRPFYSEEQQNICLLVRKRNMGINGQQIMFYSQRSVPIAPRQRRRKKARSHKHVALVEAVKSLGLTDVTAPQIDSAVRELFPTGTQDVAQTEIVRTVFVHLMRKNSTR